MLYLVVGIFLGIWLDQTFELPNIQTRIKAYSEQYRSSYIDSKEQ
jgi:hypothetical protein